MRLNRWSVQHGDNVYVFPGIGLGVLAARARRVTNGMFMAPARALADVSPARHDPGAPLLPPISALREVAVQVALAVTGQAQREGVSAMDYGPSEADVRARMWHPEYQLYFCEPPEPSGAVAEPA